jgi:hypothetical protein
MVPRLREETAFLTVVAILEGKVSRSGYDLSISMAVSSRGGFIAWRLGLALADRLSRPLNWAAELCR